MGSQDITATYGIEVDVEGADTALDAADALEKLRDSIAEDTAALGAMNKALRAMQGGVAVDIQAFKSLRAQMAAKKVEIAQNNAQLVKMKGAFQGLGPAAKSAKDAAKAHSEAAAKLRHELFGAEKSIFGVRASTLAGVNPALMLAGGFTAIALAAGVATAAVFKFGLATADARRNEQIDIQAQGIRLWYGYANAVQFAKDETEAGAKAISGALDRVSNATTIGRERVVGFAKELEAAGLRGQDLETSLKAVSTAASVGKEAGLVGLFASLRFAGQGVDNLAARVQQKLGPLVERKLLSLDSQFQRLKENFSLLFKNVNVTPILEALNKILSLFSQTKAVGYSLRIAIEALFPTTSAKTFGETAVQVFKQVVIAGLKLTVGLLSLELTFFRLRNTIRKAFDLDILKAWIATFKASIGVAADVLTKFVPGLTLLSEGPGAELGRQLGQGLRDGMSVELPAVKKSGAGMGQAALTGFRESVDAHSPSRLFFKAGTDIGEGAELGLEASAPRVQAAADSMGPAPRAGGGKGGSTIQITIAEGAITLHASGNAQQIKQDLDDALADVLERAAQRAGAMLEVA